MAKQRATPVSIVFGNTMKIRTTSLLLAIAIFGCMVQSARGQKDVRPPMTLADIQPLLTKYTAQWNADTRKSPLWVVDANPGDPLNIPGVTFGDIHDPKAGMELPIKAQLIVINQAMVPESILTTFLHEYGHALYRYSASEVWDPIDSEAEAIRFTLVALDSENLAQLPHSVDLF
ncbi:MAG: hypothetical protein WCI87_09185 [Euryarchaeota archaeon]